MGCEKTKAKSFFATLVSISIMQSMYLMYTFVCVLSVYGAVFSVFIVRVFHVF